MRPPKAVRTEEMGLAKWMEINTKYYAWIDRRNKIAVEALTGLLSNPEPFYTQLSYPELAQNALAAANAMMEVLDADS